jgi:hypothetical protein
MLLASGDPPDETALAPATASPDFTPPPAAAVAPPPGRPVVPTPEPGREGPEVTLVDTQNGGSIRLWQPGYRITEAVFEGEWLYYVRSPLAGGAEKAEVFAFSLTGHHEYKILDAFHIAVSVNGDIAFSVWDPSGAHSGGVYDRHGRIQMLAGGSGGFVWSPDGRWLTYSGGYAGDNAPIKQYILDTVTHQAREFAESLPCQCDGGPRPVWAPDSSRFMYRRAFVDANQQRRDANEVYDPASGQRFEIQDTFTWLSASSVLVTDERRENDLYVRHHFVLDLRTGALTPVFEPGWGSPSQLSPNQTMMAASDGFTARIVDREGDLVLDGAPGEFRSWSDDGRFILTNAFRAACGLRVIRISTGQQAACVQSGPVSGGGFSPDSGRVALLESRYMVNPPTGSGTPVTSDLVIVDLATGTAKTAARDMRGHLGCAAWSEDGRYVLVHTCPGV